MEINPAAYTGEKSQGQNLIDIAKVGEGTPPGFWRAIVLDFLSVASALFFGYSYFLYLTMGVSPWFTVGGLVAFAIISILQAFLSVEVGRRTLVMLGEAVAIVAAFAFYDGIEVVLIAGAVVFAALFWGYFGSRAEMQNQVEVHFFKATAGVVGKVTTAAILFLLIVYAPQAQGQGIFVPRSSFRTFFSWSANELNSFYPGVSFNDSFGKFADSFAREELAKNPSFAQLTTVEQNAAVAQAANSISIGVQQATGVAPAPGESVSDVAYDYIVSLLTNWQNRFNGQFLVVWVIILFLVFRTLGFIFVWATQLIALVIYEVLIAAGFMHIEGVPQTKEILRY